MNLEEIKQELIYFLSQKIGKPIMTDDNLWDLGLNSVKFIELIVELEKKFGITIEDDELDIDKYRSIDQLAQLVILKINTGSK